jgi:hypothetical protein
MPYQWMAIGTPKRERSIAIGSNCGCTSMRAMISTPRCPPDASSGPRRRYDRLFSAQH